MRKILKAGSLVALLFAVLTAGVWAARGDLAEWGTIDGTLLAINTSGVLYPQTTLGTKLGDSTHRFSGSYINTATGATINCTNSTLTAANVGHVYIANISGNHTLTLPTAALAGAGAQILIVEACNKIGGTGNLTLNVTSSGNINGVDTFSVTNTSGATGNVSFVRCISNGSAWFCNTERR